MARPLHSPTRRQPRFLPQATLILLPVVVLTLLGLASLRRDRTLALEQARELAGRLAQDFADRAATPLLETDPAHLPSLSPEFGLQRDYPSFTLTTNLTLASPPPYEPIPQPRPLDTTRLSPRSSAAWNLALATPSAVSPDSSAEAWNRFLETTPPPEFAAHALCELARTRLAQGHADAARTLYLQVVTDFPETLGESGLPLGPLAAWQAVLAEFSGTTNIHRRTLLLNQACTNLLAHPTALTPALLQQASTLAEAMCEPPPAPPRSTTTNLNARLAAITQNRIHSWFSTQKARELTLKIKGCEARWQTDELSRRLHTQATLAWSDHDFIQTNANGALELRPVSGLAPLWLESPADPDAPPPGPWLLLRFPPDQLQFHARTAQEITALTRTLKDQSPGFPPYFDVSLTIAGRTLPAPGEQPLLAQRAARDASQPGTREPRLAANIYLADPNALFARQRVRTRWFVALVLAAAATATIGLATTYRAFRHQLQLNQMQSNFVSSVSHELRAPIASVRLLAENLEHGRVTDTSRQQDYFRLIGQECRRLSSLIDNALDFSRIEQGRKQYELEPTDVAALLARTVQLMEPYAAERHVRLQSLPVPLLEPPPSLDAQAIQQALVNLIDNAVKHSPDGSAVTLETMVTPATHTSPATLRLSVIDQGPGIPPAERERIFEPFFRLGSELRRETPGVGIGLALVRHIVQAHGGHIQVQPAEPQGSRFTISLPLPIPALPAPPGSQPTP